MFGSGGQECKRRGLEVPFSITLLQSGFPSNRNLRWRCDSFRALLTKIDRLRSAACFLVETYFVGKGYIENLLHFLFGQHTVSEDLVIEFRRTLCWKNASLHSHSTYVLSVSLYKNVWSLLVGSGNLPMPKTSGMRMIWNIDCHKLSTHISLS